jgi:hypothetical protein
MDEETRNKLIDLISKAENVRDIPMMLAKMFEGEQGGEHGGMPGMSQEDMAKMA